jgi:hypothetical protein
MSTQKKAAGERPRTLGILFTCLAALLIAHDVDHMVHEGQLGNLSTVFYVFFALQVLVYGAVIALLARGDSLAPLAAASVAVLALVTLAGGHLTPFGPLPFTDAAPEPALISWVLLFAPMALAVLTLRSAAQRGRWRPRRGRTQSAISR